MLNKTSPTASTKLDILSRRLDQAILLQQHKKLSYQAHLLALQSRAASISQLLSQQDLSFRDATGTRSILLLPKHVDGGEDAWRLSPQSRAKAISDKILDLETKARNSKKVATVEDDITAKLALKIEEEEEQLKKGLQEWRDQMKAAGQAKRLKACIRVLEESLFRQQAGLAEIKMRRKLRSKEIVKMGYTERMAALVSQQGGQLPPHRQGGQLSPHRQGGQLSSHRQAGTFGSLDS